MGLRARRACVALCLWSACALAGEAPSTAAPAKPAPAAPAPAAAAPAPTKPEPAAAAPSAVAATEAPSPTPAPAPMAEPRFDDKYSLDSQEPPETESVGWALFRSTMVLGAVLALIYLTLNVGLRRLMGMRLGTSGREPLVTVVERIPLDPKRSMFVVKAAGEYLLVGAGDTALNLISKLDPEEVARMQRQPSTPATTPVISPFLQKLLSRRGGSQPPSA
ncbi:MAG TPA: flagellar biosynthetic protein FliO [Myxococcaceae bacterium]|nr:flagellar biosynthetic protein FliO [Myxococcaceae bacterium]